MSHPIVFDSYFPNEMKYHRTLFWSDDILGIQHGIVKSYALNPEHLCAVSNTEEYHNVNDNAFGIAAEEGGAEILEYYVNKG